MYVYVFVYVYVRLCVYIYVCKCMCKVFDTSLRFTILAFLGRKQYVSETPAWEQETDVSKWTKWWTIMTNEWSSDIRYETIFWMQACKLSKLVF